MTAVNTNLKTTQGMGSTGYGLSCDLAALRLCRCKSTINMIAKELKPNLDLWATCGHA